MFLLLPQRVQKLPLAPKHLHHEQPSNHSVNLLPHHLYLRNANPLFRCNASLNPRPRRAKQPQRLLVRFLRCRLQK
jgi:hypothetical protein